MSMWDDVHIKQRIEIVIDYKNEKMTFGGIIVRKNDSAVYFPMPSSQHAAGAIKKGAPTDVTIYTGDKALNFTTEVGGIQPGTPAQVIVSRPPEESIAARGDDGGGSTVGVSVELAVEFRFMKDPVTPISDMKKGKVVSLSSSGCTITTFQKSTPGNFIELNITLPEHQQPVTLVGKISDCVEKKIGAQSSFESFIRYEIIRPGEQDKLVKYVFAKQMSNRRRGMV